MSLAATIDAMISSGCTLEQVAAVARANLKEEESIDTRSTGAKRQARYRAKRNESVTSVTPKGVPDGSNDSITLTSLTSPKPNTKRARARTSISEEAQPSERQSADASSAGLGRGAFREQWGKFRDHHRAKGSLMADWDAAWRTWLGNRGQFQPRAGPPRGGKSALTLLLEDLADDPPPRSPLKLVGQSNG